MLLLIEQVVLNGILTGIAIMLLIGIFGFLVFQSKIILAAKTLIAPAEHAAFMDLIMRMYKNSIIGWIVADAERKVILWSPRTEVKFGYTALEAMGKRIEDLIVPDDLREFHVNGFQRYVATGKPQIVGDKFGLETEGITKDKKRIPIRLFLTDMSENGIIQVGAYIFDRTQEVERERLFREHLKLLEYAEETAEIGGWWWDLIGEPVIVTKNFRRIFCLDAKQEVTAQMLLDIVFKDDAPEVTRVIAVAREEKRDYEVDYRIQERNGEFTLIHCIGKKILDDDGEDVHTYYGTVQVIGHDARQPS